MVLIVLVVITPIAKPPISPKAIQAIANRNYFNYRGYSYIVKNYLRNTKSILHITKYIYEMEIEKVAKSENKEPII